MIDTAIQQDAPLQNILSDLAMDYERLNDLMNKRESELAGRGILIVLFVCIGLPVLIAFIVGLFAPAKSGYQISEFNTTFSNFFAAASAVGVGLRKNDGQNARYAVVGPLMSTSIIPILEQSR